MEWDSVFGLLELSSGGSCKGSLRALLVKGQGISFIVGVREKSCETQQPLSLRVLYMDSQPSLSLIRLPTVGVFAIRGLSKASFGDIIKETDRWGV